MKASYQTNSFPTLLQKFFLERLIQQRNASAQTVASYRDSFCLLLRFAKIHLGKDPERLTLSDLDAPLILAFLNYLENERHNKIRSRNARFAAIRSFMHFAALTEPAALPVIQRVLAIPMKRFDKPLLGFLSRDEMQAILDAPDIPTWCGHRDRAMFTVFYNTGGRVSEIIGLQVADVVLDGCAAVHIRGKGRKERSILAKHVDRARPEVATLVRKRLHPHSMRHSTAVALLKSGVDLSTISQWLGHASPTTTNRYATVDLAMKRDAINRVKPVGGPRKAAWRTNETILKWLESL